MRLILSFVLLSISSLALLAQESPNKTPGDFVFTKHGHGLKASLINSDPRQKILQSQTSYKVPDTVDGIPITSIGKMNSPYATNFTIPNTVTDIADGAFSGCKSLVSLNIPPGVKRIGRGTFSGCKKLTAFTIPEGVTIIGVGAFESCSSLTNISLPSTLRTIGESAFADCSNLSSITLPDALTNVSGTAFSKCISLTAITIPAAVQCVGTNAFQFCSGLTNILVQGGDTILQHGAFYSCTNLAKVTISNRLTTIENKAFYMCTKLKFLIIPDGVTKIEKNAFLLCNDLHVERLSTLLDAASLSDSTNKQETREALYRCIYALAFAEEQGANPERIIDLSFRLKGISETPLGSFLRWGLLENLKLAKGFGLTTPEGMAALRGGSPAFITEGDYTGDVAVACAVIPKQFVPELEYQMINLELAPSKLAHLNRNTVEKRQITFARELFAVKIITATQLKSIEDSSE